MLKTFLAATITMLLMLIGCSAETAKRNTYETLQNIRQQECSRMPTVECEKRESMEVYEDRREEVLQE